ncbi:PseG/SpsG family protein [Pseudobutyrivibrio sp.]|uniref:PseG/SpsG family protein n=1 Tax=Pseudobutyrivibrio sp. TaxID=2014367 RepID=UPI001D85C47F|nr:hypothetical protein [Pseudobutyrivibrio sp.]MBE5910048.1 hypothetical protein [Pseudobutyrivibrio sp.]
MKYTFICDGSNSNGTGHFFRCLSIAQEIIIRGDSVAMIVNDELESLLGKCELEAYVINGLFRKECENRVLNLLEQLACEMVIIDSHNANRSFLGTISANYYTILIDDLLMFPYPVDVILNYHIDVSKNDYYALYSKSRITTPKLLIGSKFFPMRISKGINEKKSRIDISFFAGGSDPAHVTLKLLKNMNMCTVLQKHILHIIVGEMNGDYDEINRISKEYKNIIIHYGLLDLSSIYRLTDVAITASGVTLYELVAWGIPTISYYMVNNQIHSSYAFAKLGLTINLGNCGDECFIFNLETEVERMLDNKELVNRLKTNSKKYIDMWGAKRIVDVLERNLK